MAWPNDHEAGEGHTQGDGGGGSGRGRYDNEEATVETRRLVVPRYA
ncbi:hypothetical protein HN371_09285 [Candidatus Poribacteria bacterium]|nr:hypothetical protein [Candidatus Poribacteria bacterium]MBT5710339.1 hypothetical protein [Candidatus Poribacteria bacterium]MBT7101350.1 hypothetical protein [Candidatus Poribacteria bacterium]MBT7804756.1 hypothetical protein [Candidatus Poribacteria bacterium]